MASMENAVGAGSSSSAVGSQNWTSFWQGLAGSVLSTGLEYQKAKLTTDLQTQALPYQAAARPVDNSGGGIAVSVGGGTLLLIGLGLVFLLTSRD